MSEQKTILKKIVSYLVFFLSCFVGLLVFAHFVLMGMEQTESLTVPVQTHWKIRINDQVYNDVDIATFSFHPVGIGDRIVMENVLPACPWEFPVIRIDAWYSLVDVFIDERPVFSYGYDLVAQHRCVGTGYHLIRPHGPIAGHPIKIILTVTEPAAFTKLQTVYVDKAGSSVIELWKTRGFAFGSSLFFMISGIGLVTIGLILAIRDKKNLQIAIVGLVCFFLGLVSFYDNDCAVLFSRNYELNIWVNHVALYGANFSLLILIYTSMTERFLDRLLIKLFLMVSLVYVALIILLDCNHIIHLVATRSILMSLFGCEVVVIIFMCFLNILVKSREYRIPSIGFLCMIAFIGLDLLRYSVVKHLNLDTSKFNGTMICLGGLVFLISVFVNFYKEYSSNVREKIDAMVSQQYQSMDYDTGLMSISMLPEILNNMQSRRISQYADITVTLNLDEYIQCQGPTVIENMIWAFARALNRSFSIRSYVFRSTGNSFKVILPPEPKLIDKGLSRLAEESEKARQPSMHSSFVYTVEVQVTDMPKSLEFVE